MTTASEVMRDLLQTALRMFPWPTQTGLRAVGHPGPESPVLITGNYDLTVRRLMRSLQGTDVWLLVAPSRGINVWCAAAGGLLTTHSVVTALKTSGIQQRTTQRRAILPQLAATGVSARDVARRTGWKVRFGPVYAQDIPRYLDGAHKKDDSMRRVRFGARERMEMAVAWAAPMSLVGAAVLLPTAPSWIPAWLAQAWLQSIAVFCVYDRLPRPRGAIFWSMSAVVSAAAVAAAGGGAGLAAIAAVSACGVAALLTFDYTGSTPLEGGSHFQSRRWRITLDSDRCVGVYSCWAVCPEACFEKLEDQRKVELAHEDRCVKCGACVVQCPEDALYFSDDTGARIEPDWIRRYKLNLMGKLVPIAHDQNESTS